MGQRHVVLICVPPLALLTLQPLPRRLKLSCATVANLAPPGRSGTGVLVMVGVPSGAVARRWRSVTRTAPPPPSSFFNTAGSSSGVAKRRQRSPAASHSPTWMPAGGGQLGA